MKRRLRARAERRRLIRRSRLRHGVALDTSTSAEPGGVNATVLFTETSRAGETSVWLEPDGRADPTGATSQF
jgi:hypothetical protein